MDGYKIFKREAAAWPVVFSYIIFNLKWLASIPPQDVLTFLREARSLNKSYARKLLRFNRVMARGVQQLNLEIFFTVALLKMIITAVIFWRHLNLRVCSYATTYWSVCQKLCIVKPLPSKYIYRHSTIRLLICNLDKWQTWLAVSRCTLRSPVDCETPTGTSLSSNALKCIKYRHVRRGMNNFYYSIELSPMISPLLVITSSVLCVTSPKVPATSAMDSLFNIFLIKLK